MTWGDITIPTVGGASILLLILAGLLRAIIRGDLVPKSTMDARMSDKDALVASKDRTIGEQKLQIDALIPTAEVVRQLLQISVRTVKGPPR